MTWAEFAKGTATFLVVIVAGFLSEIYLDRYLPIESKTLSSESAEASSAACVDNEGAWKNWSWSNVPILSPKCRDDR
jgi:hypothetical protein